MKNRRETEKRRQEELGTQKNLDVASSNSALSPNPVAHYRGFDVKLGNGG